MQDLRIGDRVIFFPRSNKPGHVVEIVAIKPHPFHGFDLRIRYEKDGRERQIFQSHFVFEALTSPASRATPEKGDAPTMNNPGAHPGLYGSHD